MDWQDCVVILIDIPDIKKLAQKGDSKGSSLMMEFHKLVQSQVNHKLQNIEHAYVFNDSALLLSYGDGTPASFTAFLRDADRLKQQIDSLAKNWAVAPAYGIAVKGKAFPSNEQSSAGKRVIVLRTSSYAMANCFLIESAAKKEGLKKSWYVDDRLIKYIPRQSNDRLCVELLPNDKRKIHLIDGYLWDED